MFSILCFILLFRELSTQQQNYALAQTYSPIPQAYQVSQQQQQHFQSQQYRIPPGFPQQQLQQQYTTADRPQSSQHQFVQVVSKIPPFQQSPWSPPHVTNLNSQLFANTQSLSQSQLGFIQSQRLPRPQATPLRPQIRPNAGRSTISDYDPQTLSPQHPAPSVHRPMFIPPTFPSNQYGDEQPTQRQERPPIQPARPPVRVRPSPQRPQVNVPGATNEGPNNYDSDYEPAKQHHEYPHRPAVQPKQPSIVLLPTTRRPLPQPASIKTQRPIKIRPIQYTLPSPPRTEAPRVPLTTRKQRPHTTKTTVQARTTYSTTEATTTNRITQAPRFTTKRIPARTQPPPVTAFPSQESTQITLAATQRTPAATRPATTTERPSPATTQRTPSTTHPTPATTQQTPATTQPTPATTRAATTRAAPTTTHPTPATTRATPATTQPTPATTRAAPATTRATPATTQPTPATTQPTPATTRAAPATTHPTPATTQPTLATTQHALATTRPAPATTRATPATTHSTLANTQPTFATTPEMPAVTLISTTSEPLTAPAANVTSAPIMDCFEDEEGFECCSEELKQFMDEHLINPSTSRQIGGCNHQKAATSLQIAAQEHFNLSFEAIVSPSDFANKSRFIMNLMCKMRTPQGKVALLYASPIQYTISPGSFRPLTETEVAAKHWSKEDIQITETSSL